MSARPSRIISGGQTGADRAGLDVATHLGIPWGGCAPRNWLSEDGHIPEKYWGPPLGDNGLTPVNPIGQISKSAAYRERTELNVRDCDAALLFAWSHRPTPGTQLTGRLCNAQGKTAMRMPVGEGVIEETVRIVRNFIASYANMTLLIAGSRESKAPGIYAYTYTILREALR